MVAATATSNTNSINHNSTSGSRQVIESDEDDLIRSKILLVGLRRSGKTSIQQVLFDGLNPKQSFFIETTTKTTRHKFDSIVPLEIWDCPGSMTVETLDVSLASFSAIVFVVDIQDSYHQPIARLISFAMAAYQENPDIRLEVFVHKAEALSEDFRLENFRHIQSRVIDELMDQPPVVLASPAPSGPQTREVVPHEIPLNFYLTSVYDNSVHEAFSRVVQHLLQNTLLPYLENLLNNLTSNSHASKAFLFDSRSRVFVATDNSPVDSVRHDLCCEYLSMLKSFANLYRSTSFSPSQHPRRSPLTNQTVISTGLLTAPSGNSLGSSSSLAIAASSTLATEGTSGRLSASNSPLSQSRSSSPCGESTNSILSPSASMQSEDSTNATSSKNKSVFYPSSAVSLTPDTTIVYHVITPELALVTVLPTAVWESRRGLVEYNVVFFREGIQEICAIERETRRRRPSQRA